MGNALPAGYGTLAGLLIGCGFILMIATYAVLKKGREGYEATIEAGGGTFLLAPVMMIIAGFTIIAVYYQVEASKPKPPTAPSVTPPTTQTVPSGTTMPPK
jgi:hypothetical protein